MKASPNKNFPRRPRWVRWGLSTVLFAVVPKCGACLLAYLGLAMGARVELCGAAPPESHAGAWAVVVISALLAFALIRVWSPAAETNETKAFET